jgi:hypothetical protein
MATTLTVDPDVFVGTSGDDVVNGLSTTLNAADQLDGGDGHDTLQLFGSGTFDLSALAQFANFEEVSLANLTGGSSAYYLPTDLTLDVNVEGQSYGEIHLGGNQTLAVSSASSQQYVFLSAGTDIVNLDGSSNYIIVNSSSSVNSSDVLNGVGGGYK